MPVNYVDGSAEEEYYHSEKFKTLVRSEKEHLLKTSTILDMRDKALAYAMRNNFYMFLRINGISEHLIWASAYINGIEDPFADYTNLREIFIVNEQELNNSISRSNTVSG